MSEQKYAEYGEVIETGTPFPSKRYVSTQVLQEEKVYPSAKTEILGNDVDVRVGESVVDNALREVYRSGYQTAPSVEFDMSSVAPRVSKKTAKSFRVDPEVHNETIRMYRNGFQEVAPLSNIGIPYSLELAPGQEIVMTGREGYTTGGYMNGWQQFDHKYNNGFHPDVEFPF